MMVDLLADRIADETEMVRRNPGIVDVMKLAADKQAQADMTSNALAWLNDPATMRALRAIGGEAPESPPARPRLRLGGVNG
jgi:hypothetical protein